MKVCVELHLDDENCVSISLIYHSICIDFLPIKNNVTKLMLTSLVVLRRYFSISSIGGLIFKVINFA